MSASIIGVFADVTCLQALAGLACADKDWQAGLEIEVKVNEHVRRTTN